MRVEAVDLAPDARPAVGMAVLYTSVWRYAAGGRARYLAALALLVGSQSIKLLDAGAASLPQKWDMPLSERGINLSGGQRQRLALARGLLAGERSSVREIVYSAAHGALREPDSAMPTVH